MDSSKFRRVDFIINPMSGLDEPVLGPINKAVMQFGIEDWHVHITKVNSSAETLARTALAQKTDLIAVYGGDGTMQQVARALAHTTTPMCILPGGTANALAAELRIPASLEAALALGLGAEATITEIDFCTVNDQTFLLHLSTLDNTINPDRDLKKRFGRFAYLVNAPQFVTNMKKSVYKLTVDDETVECEGIACVIANNNALGLMGLSLSSTVHLDDGRVDVFVIGDVLEVISQKLANITSADLLTHVKSHWQGKTITIDADSPHPLYADGEQESLVSTPCTVQVQPKALRVIVPRETQEEQDQ